MQSRKPESDNDAESEAKSETKSETKSEGADFVNPKGEYIMGEVDFGVILEFLMTSCLVCSAVLMTNMQCDKSVITVNSLDFL